MNMYAVAIQIAQVASSRVVLLLISARRPSSVDESSLTQLFQGLLGEFLPQRHENKAEGRMQNAEKTAIHRGDAETRRADFGVLNRRSQRSGGRRQRHGPIYFFVATLTK